jgi:hypothetical protein
MIPDQKHAAVVLVEVFGIARVMHAMSRGGVDEPLLLAANLASGNAPLSPRCLRSRF